MYAEHIPVDHAWQEKEDITLSWGHVKRKQEKDIQQEECGGSEGRSLSKTPRTEKNWSCQHLTGSIRTAALPMVRGDLGNRAEQGRVGRILKA